MVTWYYLPVDTLRHPNIQQIIFSIKEWCHLENRVRVLSRSLKMAPFDRSHTSSYSPSIVTMAVPAAILESASKNGPTLKFGFEVLQGH